MRADGALLSRLAAAVEELGPRLVGADTAIVDIHHDSRRVEPNTGFVAVVGAVADGHDYVPAAIEAGAAAVVVERELGTPVAQLVVTDTRRALPRLAAEVHGHPSRSIPLIGVTGTNGKTTVTHMLEAIARGASMKPGLVGTVGARIGEQPVHVAHTTPESSDLQRLLAKMRDEAVELVAIEVSSHALDLGRVDSVWFAVSAFTNLSQDHLDHHGDMQSYLNAKAALFTPDRTGHAVIWIDDPAGRTIASRTEVSQTTVGFAGGVVGAEPDVIGTVHEIHPTHSVIELATEGVRFTYRLSLPGRFNAANSLIAAASAAEVGVPWDAIRDGLETSIDIPGRFEPVDLGQPFTVLIDYAHTPDAVASVIDAVREMADGKVIVVVGSAGDRDPGKRPMMGASASKADIAIITSDNPRSEDPEVLVSQVVEGTSGHVVALVDRREAIGRAVSTAEPGDVVLILGKGHESGQQFADRTVPFLDSAVTAEALTGLGYSG
jgi:UDP-N-acetylmuramoyl-L-alanyl-D-glutamate--2,6-diaminopimelate ligase